MERHNRTEEKIGADGMIISSQKVNTDFRKELVGTTIWFVATLASGYYIFWFFFIRVYTGSGYDYLGMMSIPLIITALIAFLVFLIMLILSVIDLLKTLRK